MNGKNIALGAVAVVLLGAIAYLLFISNNTTMVETDPNTDPTTADELGNDELGTGDDALGEDIDNVDQATTDRGDESVLGTSVDGTEITARHFGTGANELLLIGGVHGSYSPNTAALGEELITYFEENESSIPDDVMVTVIPTLNPDGLETGGTAGRFNANDVDLNRNFDCEWSEDAVWRNQPVDAGDAPFSEPEAVALRDYVNRYEPNAAVVWFASEGKVYPSACGGAPSRASVELAATFANAADYDVEAEFDAYAITGDMVNWMAGEGIPAISVLLSDYENTEWLKNQAGVEAIINWLGE